MHKVTSRYLPLKWSDCVQPPFIKVEVCREHVDLKITDAPVNNQMFVGELLDAAQKVS